MLSDTAINGRDNQGWTPLMKAATSEIRLENTVKLLLYNGADVNARSNDGKTALTLAKEQRETRIANHQGNRLGKELRME